MLFNSFRFVVFLAIVLLIYYPLPQKLQNRFLLLASLFFYACWDWRFLAPLLLTTSLDYWCALHMNRARLILSITANLGLLAFFKYSSLNVILPIGISFYTFQAMSYTIDVYRGQLHPESSYLDFLLAVVYFPHLVAGPIQRANNLLPQVTGKRHISYSRIAEGIHLMVWGYFKKVYVADNLAPFVNKVFSDPHPDWLHVLLGAYAFAFQIFCDFSGYTDIARGVAKLMGFEFMLNFRMPYLAAGPREFWSRWHISLSTWLRDYLYKPLGGNRKGRARMYANLMITMVLGGVWHGAALRFVIWGAYHGLLLILERMCEPRLLKIPRWIRVVVFFHLTCYGWVIFRAGPLPVWGRIFSLPAIAPLLTVALTGALMAVLYKQMRTLQRRAAGYALLLYFILFRGGAQQSFIYFQF